MIKLYKGSLTATVDNNQISSMMAAGWSKEPTDSEEDAKPAAPQDSTEVPEADGDKSEKPKTKKRSIGKKK